MKRICHFGQLSRLILLLITLAASTSDYCLAQKLDKTIWAATVGGVSKTDDGGRSWTNFIEGVGGGVHSIAVRNGIVWAGTEHGVSRSSDDGHTWTTFDSDDGLPAKNYIDVSALCIQADGTLWIGCSNLRYVANSCGKTEDDGKSWTFYELRPGKRNYEISDIIECDGSIWVFSPGTRAYSTRTNPHYKFGGLFRTVDKGLTWEEISVSACISPSEILSLSCRDSTLFVNTKYGIYRSEDNGESWSLIDTEGIRRFTPSRVFAGNDDFLCGVKDSVFAIWNGHCGSYEEVMLLPTTSSFGIFSGVGSVLIDDEAIYLAVTLRDVVRKKPAGGVLISLDGGESWEVQTVEDGLGGYVYDLAIESADR